MYEDTTDCGLISKDSDFWAQVSWTYYYHCMKLLQSLVQSHYIQILPPDISDCLFLFHSGHVVIDLCHKYSWTQNLESFFVNPHWDQDDFSVFATSTNLGYNALIVTSQLFSHWTSGCYFSASSAEKGSSKLWNLQGQISKDGSCFFSTTGFKLGTFITTVLSDMVMVLLCVCAQKSVKLCFHWINHLLSFL